MFGIGTTEILIILVVALVVIGPESLPKIAKTVGKTLGEFRRISTDLQRTLNSEIALEEHEQRKKEAKEEYFSNSSDKSDKSGKENPSQENISLAKNDGQGINLEKSDNKDKV